jgi:TonB family protein
MGWVDSTTVKAPPQFVYEVKLVGGVPATNTEAAANLVPAPPNTAPVDDKSAEDKPDPAPMPPDDNALKSEARKHDLAAKTEARKTIAQPDSDLVDVHVGRIRVVSPTKNGRSAIDAPIQEQRKGEPGPGAFENLEARGSSRGEPIHITHTGNYSETYIILRAIQPRYPDHERERGIEGSVTVELLVNELGTVSDANVIELVGPMSFQNSALDAVRQFEFQAPIENGVPTPMWIKFLIKFRINS